MKTKSKYLVIEPYVHYNINEKKALFYNTISGRYSIFNNPLLISNLKKIGFNNSSSIMNISTENINTKEFKEFIINIKDLFIGDVIEANDTPFLFYQTPILNNISENNMDGEKNRNITESLHELNIFVNSFESTHNKFCDAHKQFLFPWINNKKQQINNQIVKKLISEIDNYYIRNINLIIGDLEDTNIDISLFQMNQSKLNCFVYYKTILTDSKISLLESFETLNIYISSEISKKEINTLQEILSFFDQSKIIFHLIIESEEDFNKLEKIKINYNLKSSYKPYFHKNENFFKENIYITEEDILQRKLSLNDIHQRQLINPANYGKLFITENGDVYSNLNSLPLGNLIKQNVKELIHKELSIDESYWKKTKKDIYPCSSCIYNGICPPISNYEYGIGKNNLCHVWE